MGCFREDSSSFALIYLQFMMKLQRIPRRESNNKSRGEKHRVLSTITPVKAQIFITRNLLLFNSKHKAKNVYTREIYELTIV